MSIKTYSAKTQSNLALSKNFTVHDFICKDNTDITPIDSTLIQMLQQIHDHFNKPVTITSGYRTVAYNAKIGGEADSLHCKGMAADIQVTDINPLDVCKYCLEAGFKGIGYYNASNGNITHIDTRTEACYWQRIDGKYIYYTAQNAPFAVPIVKPVVAPTKPVVPPKPTPKPVIKPTPKPLPQLRVGAKLSVSTNKVFPTLTSTKSSRILPLIGNYDVLAIKNGKILIGKGKVPTGYIVSGYKVIG